MLQKSNCGVEAIIVTIVSMPQAKELNAWESQNNNTFNKSFQFTERKSVK